MPPQSNESSDLTPLQAHRLRYVILGIVLGAATGGAIGFAVEGQELGVGTALFGAILCAVIMALAAPLTMPKPKQPSEDPPGPFDHLDSGEEDRDATSD
jgi:hypothetical protein